MKSLCCSARYDHWERKLCFVEGGQSSEVEISCKAPGPVEKSVQRFLNLPHKSYLKAYSSVFFTSQEL